MNCEHDIIATVTVVIADLFTVTDDVLQTLQVTQSEQLMPEIVASVSELLSQSFC